jgi:hypothetical protein
MVMLLLRDDLVVETFDLPDDPLDWVEWIDVENGEYAFCSDAGQKYRGELIQSGGLFKSEKWRLIPDGKPDPNNAIAIVERAVDVDPRRSCFADLAKLRQHLTKR